VIGLMRIRTLAHTSRPFSPRRVAVLLPVLGLALLFSLWNLSFSEAAAPEIVILKSSEIAAYDDAVKGFIATAPSGAIYTEHNLRGDLELGRNIAKKIRSSDVSLVVAVGLKAALVAKSELADIPVVYMMILDPQKHQLNGANMTGTLLEIPVERQLKLLHTFLPNKHRLGILYDPSKTSSRIRDAEIQAGANEYHLQGFPVASEKEVPQQLRALLSSVDALWLMPDSTVLTDESIRFILESALAQHVPVIGFSPEFTRLGALLSLSVNYGEVGRETGLLAKRILDGERILPLKPMPVERLKITVNLKTARFLGITFPKELNSIIDETY
jgi:putative tryptophan/tyrosine transport system substrate-binding protein